MRVLLPFAAVLTAACAGTASSSFERIDLDEAHIDAGAVEAFLESAEEGRFGNIDRFILMRHGKVVVDRSFERDYHAMAEGKELEDHQYDYDNPDWHPFFQGSDLHTMQSVTKSVTSLLVGIAMDDGKIPGGVETPAMSWFGDYDPDMTDPRRAAMTLEDLLTMRSGIRWDETLPYSDPNNSCIALEASEDWVQFVIDQPMREEPGTRFDYNSGVSVLLGKVVREATGVRIDEYALERLFAPLGIEDFHWKLTPRGEVDTEGGLYLRSEDLAKIAQLVLQKGEWNGRRVISEEWIAASIKPHVENTELDTGYGYQWWTSRHGEDRIFVAAGSGFGGQFPVIIPELDLVAVITAWNTWDQPEAWSLGVLLEDVLPGVER